MIELLKKFMLLMSLIIVASSFTSTSVNEIKLKPYKEPKETIESLKDVAYRVNNIQKRIEKNAK